MALDVPIGKDSIDFSHRKIVDAIEITTTFSLQLAERDALIRDIASEAPQMKNAVDGLDPSLWLEVAVKINPPPDRFAYLKKISRECQVFISTHSTNFLDTADMQNVYLVNETWQSKKLQIVPGDVFLDQVCQRFGVRFKKGIDGPRLASLMKETDIDPEIRRIIRDLGSA